MELGWIGKCEVDVSKMPRFSRQRIHKVRMFRVCVNQKHLYETWNIIGLKEGGKIVGNETVR